jgi:hypothetical protein
LICLRNFIFIDVLLLLCGLFLVFNLR